MKLPAVAVMLLFMVPAGSLGIAVQGHETPFQLSGAVVSANNGSTNNGSTGGFIGQVWDIMWGGIVSIVTYFESLTSTFINQSVSDINSAVSQSMYYAADGLFGPSLFVIVIAMTFMGSYFALAAGDAVRVVVGE